MKKMTLKSNTAKRFAFAALAAFSLAGCTSTGSTTGAIGTAAAPQTPAQIAAQICVPLEVAIAGLQADTGMSAAALGTLAVAAPQVQSACSVAAQATSSDVATLENLAFNVVLPIAQERNPQLAADLLAVKIVIAAVEQAQLAAEAGGAASAASVPSASATAPAK